MTNFGIRKSQNEEYQGNAIEEQKTLYEEDGPVTNILVSREAEVESSVKSVAEASAYRVEGESG